MGSEMGSMSIFAIAIAIVIGSTEANRPCNCNRNNFISETGARMNQ